MNDIDKILLEIKTNRYLINNLVLSHYKLSKELNNFKKLLKDKKIIKNEEEDYIKATVKEPKADDVKFEFFSITQTQYNKLVKDYGLDITQRAMVLLDDFIRDNNYIPHRNAYRALKRIMIIQSVKEKIKSFSTEALNIKDIDYKQIETKEEAEKYILSTPSHLRNVSNGVIYLKEKFGI